jgi:transcription-repair coupling factor (superfamily II helicase)
MYQKILNEAIEELRESEFKELFSDRNSDSLTQFVKDCVLETDLEIRIPDDYVNNVAERLSLYQDMDNIKGQGELDQFVKELEDRFGPIPEKVNELIRSFKLRWLAEELGIEKLVLKSNKMIGYFIANPKSEYYQSPIFTKVLDYIQKNPKVAKLSEKNDRLRIIYDDVKTLTVAYDHINRILKL